VVESDVYKPTFDIISVAEFNAIVDRIIDPLEPIMRDTEICLFIAAMSHALIRLVAIQLKG
jgi:hypothetical protein